MRGGTKTAAGAASVVRARVRTVTTVFVTIAPKKRCRNFICDPRATGLPVPASAHDDGNRCGQGGDERAAFPAGFFRNLLSPDAGARRWPCSALPSRDTFSDRYCEDNGVLCGAVIKTRGRVERTGDGREGGRYGRPRCSVFSGSWREDSERERERGRFVVAQRRSLEFFSLPAHLNNDAARSSCTFAASALLVLTVGRSVCP